MYQYLRRLFLLAALLAPVPVPAQADRPGSTQLFIDYRCRPADRPAFRRGLETEGIQRLEQWKREGVLADYLLVWNQFVDANTWDATLVVTFERYAQTERWRAIERDFPGGLSRSLLQLGTPQTSYLADRVLDAGAKGDRSKSIFVFIPYGFRAREEYLEFIKGYGVPQFDAWIEAKVIANYSVFVNHHHTGKPWDAMLVFEYTDIEGLARRDLVKRQVRERLVRDPAWKALSDGKRDVRTEFEVVMAVPLQPPK